MEKIIDRILKKRGLADKPSLSDLNAPDSWPGVTNAADILFQHLVAGSHIRVIGDYDVDGVTATVLCRRILDQVNALNSFGCVISHYLPDRTKDGYGLNMRTIEAAASDGVNVILTVDCGISGHKEVSRAIGHGMTVIVSDHHLPGTTLPPAHAVCDPLIDPECMEKGMNLAGVGQAFILLAAVCQRLKAKGYKIPRVEGQLDLVALGSIADVSTMTGQNRILCYFGMDLLARKRRPGLQSLKQVSSLPETGFLCAKDVGFSLAPRLNAAGRMESPDAAFDLLFTDDQKFSMDCAVKLDLLNSRRKEMEAQMAEEAIRQAETLSMRYPGGFVLYNPQWMLGIAGIVASRVAETFNVPVVICGKDKGKIRGSARSASGIDIHAVLSGCADLLYSFGGHSGAAGLNFAESSLEELRKRFSTLCLKLAPAQKGGKVAFILSSRDLLSAYDAEYPCASFGIREMEQVARLEPCGPGNPEPLFLSEPLTLTEFTQKGILSTLFFRTDAGKEVISKVFRLPHTPKECASDLGKRVIALYSPEISFFRGETTVNISIKEMAAL